jgi:hypothetical protein
MDYQQHVCNGNFKWTAKYSIPIMTIRKPHRFGSSYPDQYEDLSSDIRKYYSDTGFELFQVTRSKSFYYGGRECGRNCGMTTEGTTAGGIPLAKSSVCL